jgi:hypothetical protein
MDHSIQNLAPKKRAFLAAYGETCNIGRAAKAAGIDRQSHYDWLAADENYRQAFKAAREQAVDALEDEAVRRANEGVERAVTVAGEREIVKEYSDTVLIFLLKGARPERYRDNLWLEGAFQLNVAAITERLRQGRERVARMKRLEGSAEGSLNAENEA